MVLLKNKTIVGLSEKVVISNKAIRAKIDTGAEKSSIDIKLAAKLGLGPIVGVRRIKKERTRRPVIKVPIKIRDRKLHAFFNISDRKGMKYKILIGQNILKRDFLINPSK